MNKAKITKSIAALTAAAFIGGCASGYDAPLVAEELVWSSNGEEQRPDWTLSGNVEQSARNSEDVMLFVGMSDRHSTQRAARDAAMTDARAQVTDYVSTQVENQMTRTETGEALQDDIQNNRIEIERVTQEVASFAVRNMDQNEWRYEQWRNSEEGAFYKAFVQVSLPSSQLSEQVASEQAGD